MKAEIAASKPAVTEAVRVAILGQMDFGSVEIKPCPVSDPRSRWAAPIICCRDAGERRESQEDPAQQHRIECSQRLSKASPGSAISTEIKQLVCARESPLAAAGSQGRIP